MDWDTLLHLLCRDNENAPRWTNSEWLDLLYRGSDKNKLHDYLTPDGFIHYMRASQGHSGGSKFVPLLLENV